MDRHTLPAPKGAFEHTTNTTANSLCYDIYKMKQMYDTLKQSNICQTYLYHTNLQIYFTLPCYCEHIWVGYSNTETLCEPSQLYFRIFFACLFSLHRFAERPIRVFSLADSLPVGQDKQCWRWGKHHKKLGLQIITDAPTLTHSRPSAWYVRALR